MNNTIITALATLALLPSLIHGQMNPLPLHQFTTPTQQYVASLATAQAPPLSSYQLLPAGSPLGLYRYTYFSLGPNPDGQTSTVSIGNGVCVVSTGFDSGTGFQLIYGYTPTGVAPLGLNLSGYSAFRLKFQAISSTQSLYVNIVVFLHNGLHYDFERVLPPTPNAISEDFPFASANTAGQSPFDPSDIDYLVVAFEGGGSSASFRNNFISSCQPMTARPNRCVQVWQRFQISIRGEFYAA